MAHTDQPDRIVIAGGSGFVGISLAQHLATLGYDVVILSRSKPQTPPGEHAPWRHAAWDGATLGDWTNELDGAAGLVNLCGRTVDCIKTKANRKQIMDSRVGPTKLLGEAMRAIENPPPAWVQMSTAHIYGDPPTQVCDESSPFGEGLAPTVGQAWEKAFDEAKLPETRGVVLRTSFVIGKPNAGGGGAMARLGLLATLGLGGTVGHGNQGMSWIHELDMNRIFEKALTDGTMQGVYVATSPNPASNKEFMHKLRKALNRGLGRYIGLPAPAWLVRIGAPLLMRTDPELAILGRYCVPTRLMNDGFGFEYAELNDAMHTLNA
ncbi:MAG: hypothetical protein ACI89L_002803 [Phycisphaerales bacterium]|jgi:uncharacterized protein (TIGR01777 family)